MIFVFGGVHQGKLDFVKENYQYCNIFNSKTSSLDELFNYDVVINFEYVIKKLLESNINPKEFIEDNLNKFSNMIIVGNEIGLGVVPVEKFERIWRDETGFAYQLISKNSSEVFRLWNGIPQKLK